MRRFSLKNQIYQAFREVTADDLTQLSPFLTSHILRFVAYATDELHIPPDVFDPRWTRSTLAANSPRPRSGAR